MTIIIILMIIIIIIWSATRTAVLDSEWNYYSILNFIINFIQTNTFQCVLASAGNLSFVIFLYADDGIEWTTGGASGGENRLGGTPAQAGFDAGNQMDFLLIEGSFTNDIINIDKKSNVGQPGLFVFK